MENFPPQFRGLLEGMMDALDDWIEREKADLVEKCELLEHEVEEKDDLAFA